MTLVCESGQNWKSSETRWSLVQRAIDGVNSSQAREALGELLETHRKPMYLAARRRGLSYSEAEDAVAAFHVYALESDLVKKVDQARGHLRGFLNVSFSNFVSKLQRGFRAQCRGGGMSPLSLDEPGVLEAASQVSDAVESEKFDRDWARDIYATCAEQLERIYADAGQQALYRELQRHFLGVGVPARQIATELNISEGSVKQHAFRYRRRLGVLIREVIGQTVSGESQIDEECRYLIRTLARVDQE